MSEKMSTFQMLSLGLIIVAILVSAASLSYTMGINSKTAEISKETEELSSATTELDSSVQGLSSAVGDLTEIVGASGEEIQDILSRLEELEKEGPKPEPTERVVLRLGLATSFETTDPPIWYSDLLNGIGELVTERLTTVWEEDGQVVTKPVLAESWDWDEDLTWTFYLKKGVKFSDGSDFTAEDVYYSIWGRQEQRPPNMLWSIDERVADVEIIDDYTIKFVTKFKINNFPVWVSHGWDSVMSYDAVKKSGQENVYPIEGVGSVLGTGPYMWTELEPLLFAKMTLNPYWRGETPQITDIEIYYLPDDDARVAALESGSVDFIDSAPLEALELLEDEGFTILSKPGTGFRCLALNNVKPPLDDIRVRQALAYAINYDELLETIVGPKAIRPRTVIPPAGLGAGDFVIYDYDPDKAKQLLEEAGYGDGLELKWAVRAGQFARSEELAAAIQSYLRDIGVNVEISVLERSSLHVETIVKRNQYLDGEDVEWIYDILWGGWLSDTLYAGDDMFSLYRSESDHNYWYYHNSDVDELILFSVSTAPLDERIEASLQAQQIMMEECAMIPIVTTPYISASTPDYTGHVIRPNVYEYFGGEYGFPRLAK